MRKLYPLLLLLSVPGFIFAQAQRKAKQSTLQIKRPAPVNAFTGSFTDDCDTLNFPIPDDWAGTTYLVTAENDFVNGTNTYADKQKANFFDLSATAYTYLTGTYVAFGNANSTVEDNMAKTVAFRIFEDNAGAPGALLATEERALSEIKQDVDGGFLTEVPFSTPVELPASKKFYVSVDISNFAYPDDSIWIAGTTDGQAPNQAWEQWSDDSWHSYEDSAAGGWGFAIVLWIFPTVSTSSTGCAVLPVKLLSFNALRSNNDVTLNWQIAEESGMKGYEIERADNNNRYKTVASIPALNSAKNQSYSATDRNAFALSSTVQYRLKQIDKDGTTKYSKTINVKSTTAITDVSFANPFSGALKLQVNLASAQPVKTYLYDMQGRLVAFEKEKLYNAASNTIILNAAANLPKGLYVLKLVTGTEQAVYKILKQ